MKTKIKCEVWFDLIMTVVLVSWKVGGYLDSAESSGFVKDSDSAEFIKDSTKSLVIISKMLNSVKKISQNILL